MNAPLILALALAQAPAAPAANFQMADDVAQPRLAAGIEVIRVQLPTPVEAAGPVVPGVVPSVSPSRWARRYVATNANGAISLGGSWEEYFARSAQQVQLEQLYTLGGYRAGQALWAAKARAEGKPAPVDYGLRGGPAPSSSSPSSSSVSGSNFSGGMYVGSPSGGGRAGGTTSTGGGGRPGAGKRGADLP